MYNICFNNKCGIRIQEMDGKGSNRHTNGIRTKFNITNRTTIFYNAIRTDPCAVNIVCSSKAISPQCTHAYVMAVH